MQKCYELVLWTLQRGGRVLFHCIYGATESVRRGHGTLSDRPDP